VRDGDTQPLPWVVYDRGTAQWTATCPDTGARGYGGTKDAALDALRDALRGKQGKQ
jgi:hypothetical protein